MKRNNKTWIRQLSESYIRQTLNEMALTPKGVEDVKKIDDNLRGSLDRGHPAREYLANYHELLRTHPTKIFDGEGNHVGNIRHEDLDGKPMGGPSKEEVESHDDSLHHYAYKAYEALGDHAEEYARQHGHTPFGREQPWPHAEHVRAGRSQRMNA